jgi:hypothetical protein
LKELTEQLLSTFTEIGISGLTKLIGTTIPIGAVLMTEITIAHYLK